MHILVTNDDGIGAPGLLALAESLEGLGERTVLAPDHNWSASGHVKTMHRPLRVWDTRLHNGMPAHTTDGAPSDCVALAVLGLLHTSIDFVVSGINPHVNVGHDVTYSGTVTAAMEAAIAGLPGLAVSVDSPEDHSGPLDYGPAAQVARAILQQVIVHGLPKGVLLNINVPYLPVGEMSGIRITRQGQRIYRDALIRREDPRHIPYFWIGGEAPTGVPEEGTDFWAVRNGFVSITPLQLDLTAASHMDAFARWDLGLPQGK
jgi:5'-nucleotidase